jgi:hypothetical protein
MKLLIDECLSEELAHLARERGHLECSHVRWLGKGSWQDRNLISVIIEGSWTFVTRNSRDFRGDEEDPSKPGLLAKQELHAGLICLNAPKGMDLDLMIELFERALDELERDPDLFNVVLEITKVSDDEERLLVRRYHLPEL